MSQDGVMRASLVLCLLGARVGVAFHAQSLVRHPLTWLSAKDPVETDEDGFQVGFGQSFIGGDPCSSGYNSDPFDEQNDVPDSWEAMKKRIQDKVEKRQQAEKEAR